MSRHCGMIAPAQWLARATVFLSILLFLTQTSPAQRRRFEPGPPSDPQEAARLGSRGFQVHDPSTIVNCDDVFWMSHTGRGVSSAYSANLLRWERGSRVFTNAPLRVAETVPENRRMHDWAPDIIHHDNRYLLYYSVSSFGKHRSAIVLATNPTLAPDDPGHEWVDQGVVIQSDPAVDCNVIDPALFRDEDGSLWMSFGSFWGGIKLIQLDPETGKRIAPDSPVYALAHYDSIEASFIHRHGDYYYLFVNWGFCCRGTNCTYEIRVGRSDQVTGLYRDMEGRDLLVSGGTRFLGTDGAMIGPGHAGILREGEQDLFSFHLYDGTRQGVSTYVIRPMRWAGDRWPQLEPERSKCLMRVPSTGVVC